MALDGFPIYGGGINPDTGVVWSQEINEKEISMKQVLSIKWKEFVSSTVVFYKTR